MLFENLLLETREQIAFVTVNRPQVRNALNEKTVEELDACFSGIQQDPEVRVVILTGSGEKAFVAGADINELAKYSPREAMKSAQRGQAVLSRIETMGKPTIAAINGFALGGGCELALACTIRIASETAQMGQPEVKLGIIPGFGGSQRLPRLIGRGMALQMILTGELLSAHDAFHWGLVNQVVPADQLMAAAEAIARKIIANGPLAVQYCMDSVHRGLNMTLEEGLHLESTLFGMSFDSEDMREGTRAFLEKRPARFVGR